MKTLDKETFELYAEALAEFQIESIERELNRHIKTSAFFPKVSDLIVAFEPDNRTYLGPTYLPGPTMTRGMRVANMILLKVLTEAGGVGGTEAEQRHKISQLVAIKNAEAVDWSAELAKDDGYRKEFQNRLKRELRDQLRQGEAA